MEQAPKGLPVLSGRLRERREDIKQDMVSYSLSEFDRGENITVQSISRALSDKGFTMDQADIKKRLDSLSDSGIIDHISGDEYEIIDTESFDNFEDKIEILWDDFRIELDKEYENIDLQNLDEDMKTVFMLFFDKLYNHIFESTDDLVDSKVDPLSYVDTTEILENLIEDHHINKKNVYKESLLEYLNNPSDKLSEVNQILYTATINYHILKSGKNIDFNSIPTEGRVLFYDTNILVTMLCKSKDLNPIVSAITKRSKKFGFDQYYISETADELDELIRMSKREMDDIGALPPDSEPVKNELLEEYYFGNDFDNLSEYYSFLSDWRMYVKTKHNLEEFNSDIQKDAAVYDWSRETIREFDKASGELDVSEKDPENIKLDAAMLAIMATLRGNIDSDLDVGPNIISRDNDVIRTSNSGQPHFWDYNVAVNPRQWLNYLLAFTKVEFDEQDWDNIAKGILNMSTSFDQEWTINKYAGVLADKLDYQGDKETLEKFMIESPRNRDIRQGLEEGDGNKVEQAVAETAGNEKFCKAFQDSLDAQEKADFRAEKIKELRKENQQLREDVPESDISLEVDASHEANIENSSTSRSDSSSSQSSAISSADSKQEVMNDVNEFIQMLDNNLESGIEGSDVPTPPEDPSNLEITKQWLDDFVDYVNTGSNVAKSASLLAPAAKELIPAVTALI